MRIVLATANAGKIREFRELLAPLHVDVLPQSEFTRESAAETGLSFIENAILKARFASRVSGLPSIADDSGLEVDGLHGAPGIYSARYAGERASDEENLLKLLNAVRPLDNGSRTARYQCALAFMRWETDPSPLVCQASWEGRIVLERRGTGGFGYDPIFEVAGDSRTAAELSSAEKHRISHRGEALQAMLAMLTALKLE
jgi:XTP/dITP diphosphohydrolase